MKRLSTISMLLVCTTVAGCSSYLSTAEVASRLNGHVLPGPNSYSATIVSGSRRIVVQTGTSLALINGKGVRLKHPARLKGGRIEVSADLLDRVRTAGPVGPVPVTPGRNWRMNYIVLDPGHGGHDTGATCAGVLEKDINLAVCLKAAEFLRRAGMKVTLTRSDDRFIDLRERSRIANRTGADLFVSVHVNACPQSAPRGIEVYYLKRTFKHAGQYYNDRRRARELNAGYHPSSAWSSTGDTLSVGQLNELMRRWREASGALASDIEQHLVKETGFPTRGVKQQSFSVLKWTCAPAVLIETGFITKPVERARLSQSAFQARLARAIAQAILAWRQRYGER